MLNGDMRQRYDAGDADAPLLTQPPHAPSVPWR